MSEKWMENFKGRCLTCYYAQPTNRKMEMECLNNKAWDRGISYAGSGGRNSESVHKLFGCVYWKSFVEEQRKVREKSKQVKSLEKDDFPC